MNIAGNLKPLYLQRFFCGRLPVKVLKADASLPGPVKELKYAKQARFHSINNTKTIINEKKCNYHRSRRKGLPQF